MVSRLEGWGIFSPPREEGSSNDILGTLIEWDEYLENHVPYFQDQDLEL